MSTNSTASAATSDVLVSGTSPTLPNAERLIEHVGKMIDEADLRIIDLEQIRDIASTYGPRDDE